MLIHTNPGTIMTHEDHLDLSTAKFSVKKGVLYQIIYFRRVYFFLFLVANFAINFGVYLFSDSIHAAVIGFIAIHFGKAAKT